MKGFVRFACRRAPYWVLAFAAVCCVFVNGCSGGGGLGAGTATLNLTVSQIPGTGLLSQSASRAIGFNDTLVGGGDLLQGVTVRCQKKDGSLDLEVVTNVAGQVLIGGLTADTFILTIRGSAPGDEIAFPLIVEGPGTIIMRSRLERDQTSLLLNAQAITDSNNDGISDDGYRLTVTGQRPSGGGTLIIHHGTSSDVPASEHNLRITASLDAAGDYTVQQQFIDSDDDGIPDA
jgi:hypothetical protein